EFIPVCKYRLTSAIGRRDLLDGLIKEYRAVGA
ncbi:MAG: hypothetical protein QOG21_1943, partial [Actinomycetota bacterium]|nr:hypothetical protein [Actinomycetota bacterium]